jgi:hypothetical protein
MFQNTDVKFIYHLKVFVSMNCMIQILSRTLFTTECFQTMIRILGKKEHFYFFFRHDFFLGQIERKRGKLNGKRCIKSNNFADSVI